jgi:hypothetical protein
VLLASCPHSPPAEVTAHGVNRALLVPDRTSSILYVRFDARIAIGATKCRKNQGKEPQLRRAQVARNDIGRQLFHSDQEIGIVIVGSAQRS